MNKWMSHKDDGKKFFRQEKFEEALTSYRAALLTAPDDAEKQILLSNIVACRLKIGGPAMAAAAVEEAKQCIAIQDKWAKGHVRLASAYMALGGHSNDACNALQRAVSLDPTNRTARQMLIQELKRRDAPQQRSESTTDRTSAATGRRSPPPPPQNVVVEDDVEECLTMKERIQLYWIRTATWYHSQPEDVQTLLKVMVGLVILYVTFGGRFGLEGFGSRPRAQYAHDNASYRFGSVSGTPQYNTVNNHNLQQPRGSYVGETNTHNIHGSVGPGQSESPDFQGTNPHGEAGGGQPRVPDPDVAAAGLSYQPDPDTINAQRRQTTGGYDDDYQPKTRSSSSFQFPNLFDGSFPSIICLLGIAYICHRNGINPYQVFMMLNMVGAGRRGGMGYGGMGYGMGMGGMGYGGMGMGMAGMGYGMARNAGMFGGGQPARPGQGYR